MGQMTSAFAIALALALPATFAGSQIGQVLYRRLDTRGFDRVVLGVLTVSGIALIFAGLR